MTLPYERTRAVTLGREFLCDLLDPSKTPRVPRVVRQHARAVLRHYPYDYEMERACRRAPDVFGSVAKMDDTTEKTS